MSQPPEPVFPLTLVFADGTRETVQDAEQVEHDVEWLDTEDPQDEVEALDALGREVNLLVRNMRLLRLRLKDP